MMSFLGMFLSLIVVCLLFFITAENDLYAHHPKILATAIESVKGDEKDDIWDCCCWEKENDLYRGGMPSCAWVKGKCDEKHSGYSEEDCGQKPRSDCFHSTSIKRKNVA
ncbi:hypothetical protein KIN20_036507 [Parelaphostrongylus tenuis]|uniref:Uncharacterized protein n=1 Tax=Parelaphostrongylus tenuis TaxID=148309 RepID=A0AAD5RCM2_PARTN|nr:hypothetical protein KIN20_036507 [Parelaphostrongylus tenuis]